MVLNQWIYCIIINLIPSVTLPTPYYSRAFSVFHYAFLLHRCNVFHYYSLSIISSLHPPPCYWKIWYYIYIVYCISVYLYMIMFAFVYTLMFWTYLPHMKENMWTLSSEPGLLYLPWWFQVPFTWPAFTCKWHFLTPFISCRASELFLFLSYCVVVLQ
jgi:hypothetical protein